MTLDGTFSSHFEKCFFLFFDCLIDLMHVSLTVIFKKGFLNIKMCLNA